VLVVDKGPDQADYAAMLAEQRRWVEREMQIGLDDLQPSAVEEYRDPVAYYRSCGALTLLARAGDVPVGIAALRPLGGAHGAGRGSTAELKRVYVRPEARGLGAGRALVEKALEVARRTGVRRVVLESHEGFMSRAVDLYRRVGFVDAPPLGLTRFPGVLTLEMALGTPEDRLSA
jgi:GNAT superfamily N-acetyltransferase